MKDDQNRVRPIGVGFFCSSMRNQICNQIKAACVTIFLIKFIYKSRGRHLFCNLQEKSVIEKYWRERWTTSIFSRISVESHDEFQEVVKIYLYVKSLNSLHSQYQRVRIWYRFINPHKSFVAALSDCCAFVNSRTRIPTIQSDRGDV